MGHALAAVAFPGLFKFLFFVLLQTGRFLQAR